MYNEWLELLQEAKDAGMPYEDILAYLRQEQGEEADLDITG